MNNEKLIINAAVQHGLYTIEEVEEIIAEKGELPLHSASGWKKRSPAGYEYRIKKGEHGLETRLWKKRKVQKNKKDDSKQKDDTQKKVEKSYFYLAKTYLFTLKQMELIKREEKEHEYN